MISGTNRSTLNDIVLQVQDGRVVLFIGAGASCSAGGPTGKKLTQMVKDNFENIDQSLEDFIEVCQDVIDTPPYCRNDLEGFIKSKLDLLHPSKAHQELVKYNWASILTTNFDDLIEVSYRLGTKRLKPCQVIDKEKFSVTPSDRSKLYLFKIMGSMNAAENDSGSMVLSRSDYNRALLRRREYFKILADFVKNGSLVFIGYSFGDRIVFDVIDELIDIYGRDRLPWSYALFQNLDEMDNKKQAMFSSRKIIPVECSFEAFFQFLSQNYNQAKTRTYSKQRVLRCKNKELIINDQEYRQYTEVFNILHEDNVTQDPGEKEKFYMGANKSWGAFKKNWDFQRDLYISPEYSINHNECLKDRIFNELNKVDIDKNKVILLKGMAGTGKTTTLKRIAFDIYKSGEAAVIMMNQNKTTFDYKLISTFIENLIKESNKGIDEAKKRTNLKLVIIIDNAAALIRHVNRLKDYLGSRGRSVLIIAAERTGEWDLIWNTFPFKISKKNIYTFNEKLSKNEKTNIVNHFFDLGFIPSNGSFWDDIIDSNYENSYFATIYSLVHPSRKPLDEIIKDQYQKLTDLTQKAYKHICCFHQFDIPINLELLVRSLKCSYSKFEKEVILKDASKVIFDEKDEIGNIFYMTHNRIIAKKTMDFFHGDPELQKEIFIEILNEAILSNRVEREICEKLLINYIGPNSKTQFFTKNQQRQIFRCVCHNNPIRSLYHHWGILESDDNALPEAEKLLSAALEMPNDTIDSYRGESDQNILTSLGSVYSQQGLAFVKKNLLEKATEYFQKAEFCFSDAKHGDFPNVYAYHSHAYMWFQQGKSIKDEALRISYFTKSIEILALAKDNINQEDLQLVYELENSLWNEIGDKENIEKNLLILRDRFQSAQGYYLSTQFLYNQAHQSEGEERQKTTKLALRKIEKGLNFFPNDEHCLRLKCKLLKEVATTNLKDFYDCLLKWKSVSTLPSAWLLYELGRSSFILGYYELSEKYFRELESGVGMGHRLRSHGRHAILDNKNNKKVYEGTVQKIQSFREGYIRCNSLRDLKYDIPFRPVSASFTPSPNDMVQFFIKFNYRGALADQIKKL